MAVTEVVKIIPDAIKTSIFKAKKVNNHEIGKGIEQNLLNSKSKEYM
jgi:hypothetical protein